MVLAIERGDRVSKPMTEDELMLMGRFVRNVLSLIEFE